MANWSHLIKLANLSPKKVLNPTQWTTHRPRYNETKLPDSIWPALKHLNIKVTFIETIWRIKITTIFRDKKDDWWKDSIRGDNLAT